MDKIESIGIETYLDFKLPRGFSGGGFPDPLHANIYLTVRADALENNLNTNYFYVSGYYEARTFFAPRYEIPGNKPDLRATIHWLPQILTDENGEATVNWYNADPKTKVRIVAEGITDKGIPFSAQLLYDVK